MGTGYWNEYKVCLSVQNVEMGTGCCNRYRIFECVRMWAWVHDIGMGIGCGNEFRMWEWVQDFGMGTGCGSGYRILEWVRTW